jgi:hypothetical protein
VYRRLWAKIVLDETSMNVAKHLRWIILLVLLAIHSGLLFWPRAALAGKLTFHDLESLLQVISMFLLFSQPFLLAAWAVFGSEHFAIRLARAILIFALMNIRFLLDVPHGSDALGLGEAIGDAMTEGLLIIQVCLFVPACVLFTLARLVLKWRIILTENWQLAVAGSHRAKFRLSDLFQLTALAAVVLALGRDLPGARRLIWPYPDASFAISLCLALLAGSVIAILTLPFLPLALAQCTRRKFVWPATASVVAAYAALVGYSLIFEDSPSWNEIIATPMSYFGSIFLSLWLVRLAGFRLLRKTDVAAKNMLARA